MSNIGEGGVREEDENIPATKRKTHLFTSNIIGNTIHPKLPGLF